MRSMKKCTTVLGQYNKNFVIQTTYFETFNKPSFLLDFIIL